VSGALLAASAGVGFGFFQSLNARPVPGFEDPYLATLIQVGIATVALTLAAAVTGELSGIGHAPASSLGEFAVAGCLHFLAGWSLLNLSQRRIGAARTSPLLTTVPVFGVAIAAVTLGELPGLVALVAIALMTLGAYVVAMRGGQKTPRASDAAPGLACALCWALSPVFTRRGLEGFDSPLAGLVVGLVVSMTLYVPLYVALRGGARPRFDTGGGLALKSFVGLLVGLATWTRWEAIERTPVGVVLALSLLSVPVVLLLAPVIAGRHLEHVTAGLWAGASLVVGGALILVVA
jgi:drug/metabolite transporter (DMT)-like permease